MAVRLGVMQGEFHWHKHDELDEFFFVLDGLFRIELEGRDTVELGRNGRLIRAGACWLRRKAARALRG